MKVLDPTYLRYVYDGIQIGSISSENSSVLPDGLVGVYEEAFNGSISAKERNKQLEFFSVWALLKKEVSISFILPLLSDWTEEQLFENISVYSKWFNSPVSGKFQLYHERFRAFIIERMTAEKIKFYNNRIIHHCREALSEKSNSEWEYYALEYLSTHLLLPAMEESNNDSLKTLAYDTNFWNRQIEVSKGYDWTKKMHNETMLWASKYDDDQVIECALNKVDLYNMEQNDAPRIVEMVAQNDIETALQRIESFAGNDKEGLQRKFILYMLCLMELTLLDSKDKPFRKEAIEKILKHLDENIPVEHDLLNWNNFFPGYLMYLMLVELDTINCDANIILSRKDSNDQLNWISLNYENINCKYIDAFYANTNGIDNWLIIAKHHYQNGDNDYGNMIFDDLYEYAKNNKDEYSAKIAFSFNEVNKFEHSLKIINQFDIFSKLIICIDILKKIDHNNPLVENIISEMKEGITREYNITEKIKIEFAERNLFYALGLMYAKKYDESNTYVKIANEILEPDFNKLNENIYSVINKLYFNIFLIQKLYIESIDYLVKIKSLNVKKEAIEDLIETQFDSRGNENINYFINYLLDENYYLEYILCCYKLLLKRFKTDKTQTLQNAFFTDYIGLILNKTNPDDQEYLIKEILNFIPYTTSNNDLVNGINLLIKYGKYKILQDRLYSINLINPNQYIFYKKILFDLIDNSSKEINIFFENKNILDYHHNWVSTIQFFLKKFAHDENKSYYFIYDQIVNKINYDFRSDFNEYLIKEYISKSENYTNKHILLQLFESSYINKNILDFVLEKINYSEDFDNVVKKVNAILETIFTIESIKKQYDLITYLLDYLLDIFEIEILNEVCYNQRFTVHAHLFARYYYLSNINLQFDQNEESDFYSYFSSSQFLHIDSSYINAVTIIDLIYSEKIVIQEELKKQLHDHLWFLLRSKINSSVPKLMVLTHYWKFTHNSENRELTNKLFKMIVNESQKIILKESMSDFGDETILMSNTIYLLDVLLQFNQFSQAELVLNIAKKIIDKFESPILFSLYYVGFFSFNRLNNDLINLINENKYTQVELLHLGFKLSGTVDLNEVYELESKIISSINYFFVLSGFLFKSTSSIRHKNILVDILKCNQNEMLLNKVLLSVALRFRIENKDLFSDDINFNNRSEPYSYDFIS